MPNPCIELHAPHLKGRFDELVKSGMSEREAGRKAAMEDFAKLDKELIAFKESIGIKLSKEQKAGYKEPDNSAKVKEITDAYADKIKAASQPPEVNVKESPSKKEESIQKEEVKPITKKQLKEERDALLNRTPTNAREAILQHFAGGGRISTADIKRELGLSGKDLKTKIWAHSNNHPSIDRLVLDLKEELSVQSGLEIEEDVLRNEIIDVLHSHVGKSSMIDELRKMATKEDRLTEYDLYEGLESDEIVRNEFRDSDETDQKSFDEIDSLVDSTPDEWDSFVDRAIDKFSDEDGNINIEALTGFIKSEEFILEDIAPKKVKQQLQNLINNENRGTKTDAEKTGSKSVTKNDNSKRESKKETPKEEVISSQSKTKNDGKEKSTDSTSEKAEKVDKGGDTKAPTTKQQLENFGVPKEDVEATNSLLGQVFDGLKKAGLTAAKTVGEWVGIGKGEEKAYSLKINGKDTQVKNVSPEVVNGFYSPLEKTINETKFDKLPAKQWAEKFANGEEAKWTGLKDWLAQQQGSVSKADIQQFLKDNRIQVVEVVKGNGKAELEKQLPQGDYLVTTRQQYQPEKPIGGFNSEKEAFDFLHKQKLGANESINVVPRQEYISDYLQNEDNTKFSQYQTEGEKSNYKEVLVTMPPKERTKFSVKPKSNERVNGYGVFNNDTGKFDEGVYNTSAEAQKMADSYNEATKGSITERKDAFKSSHFDEPNILVHLRMNTRTDAQGNKVLFLEEVQSDWGQKGKKEGFDNKELEKRRNELLDERRRLEQQDEDNIVRTKVANTGSSSDYKLSYKDEKLRYSIVDRQKEIDTEIKKINDQTGIIPEAPFIKDTNSWTKLGLKVALKEAVKQGATKIAWTTGEQQNERYDLSKTVDLVVVRKGETGKLYRVAAWKNTNAVMEELVPPEKIADYVGKEIAEKALAGQEEFEGLDLKVGGKGMKGFYGSPKEGSLGIVGNVAKSLFKQEPKTVDIEQAYQTYDINENDYGQWEIMDKGSEFALFGGKKFTSKKNAEDFLANNKRTKTSTQHSITITPELKASVEGGQPLFKDAEAQYRIESGKNIVEAIKNFDGSKRATVALTHEIMHPTVVSIIDGAKEGNEVGTKHTQTIVSEYNKATGSNVTSDQLVKDNDAFKQGKTTERYRAVQEFIAESWEKYHTEGGKGFSKAFQEVLDQITKAFQSVYNSITGKQLTPELKQMFDELLGKEQQVKTEKTFTEKSKKIAEKIRSFKSKPLELKDEKGNPIIIAKKGIDQNDIIEGIAKLVEAGGQLADAIATELSKHKWYNDLTDKGKEGVRKQFEDHLSKDVTGITHEKTEETRTEFGLGDFYEKTTKEDEALFAEADKQIKEGYNIESLISKLEQGHIPSDLETTILKKYKATVEAKIAKDPSDENLADLRRLVKATDVAGTLAGRGLRSRQGLEIRDDSLAGYFTRETDVNQDAPLTETQKERVIKEHTEITEAQKAFNDKIAELEAENAKLKADAELKKIKANTKKTKKTHDDFVAERKSLIDQFKEEGKFDKNKPQAQGISLTNKQVVIIGKLAKSYVDEGISKLGDVVTKIASELGLNERDVQDVLAGEYNEKKKTKTELAQTLLDIKEQARLINKLDALLRGETPKVEKAKIQRNQEIEGLRKRIKDLQKERADAERKIKNDESKAQRDASKKTPEQQALDNLKKRYEREINIITEDLRTGNFDKSLPKPPLKLDKEAIDLKDRLIKLKREREVRLIQQEYSNRTAQQRAVDKVVDVLNVPRTLMSSMDFSAPLRQAAVATISHPQIAAGAGLEMFKQSVSQKRFDRWFSDVRQMPRWKLMEQSGLYVADPHDPRLTAKEEAFMNNLAEKIPIIGKLIKGSERAYVGYLNKMRVDLFNRFADAFEAKGHTFENSPELFKGLASYVNNSTGRGKLGVLESSAPMLNTAFFAPRLIASRLNTIYPLYYKQLPKPVRVQALKDMGIFIGVGMTVLALASLAGADVEKDPRSSDFGKIKDGNTRWDIWGGYQAYIRVLAQFFTGQSKSARTGSIQELSGEGAFGRDRGDVVGSFLRGKLAPIPAMTWNLIKGETMTGEKATPFSELREHMMPMIAGDLKDAMKDRGVRALYEVGLPSMFGIGASTYLPRGYDKVNKKDPVYEFLYKKNMNLSEPQQGELTDDEYKKMMELREPIFRDKWKVIIENGALIDKEGKVTIDKDEDVSKKKVDELNMEELSSLMKSVGNSATREAKKKVILKEVEQKKSRRIKM